MKTYVTGNTVTTYKIENGRVVATAGMDLLLFPSTWWINRVFVSPELRGQGVGSQLLNTLKENSKGKPILVHYGGYGADPVKQRSFYLSNGFKEQPKGGLIYHNEN